MYRKSRLLIGTAVIAAVTATGTITYARAAGAGTARASGYCALMADGVGLYVGNRVTQMGYSVGRIDGVRPEGDHVEVSFSLDTGREYPADVRAVTRSKSILADRSLELVGNYEEGPRLARGRCIALQATATPKSLSEITGSAGDFIDHIAPDDGTRSVAQAVDGLTRALAGNGDPAHQLMQTAAQAMASPDRMVSDIGAIIHESAPLTSDALAHWSSIHHVLDIMPTVLTSATYGLWPGVNDLLVGMGPLVAVLYEIQTQYGADIWPMADQLADVIHLAATRAGDIAKFLEVIPPIAAFLGTVGRNESAVRYRPPTVMVSAPDGSQVGVDLLAMVIAKEGR
ncbi:MlaD family protein [Nocardia sp. NBC_00565]|uniref:MlaD family protein n=1 Tax=Nocardia sp. NBC_00565 TaxID=2975993 RepID=UPI002E800267|nr:MlaD family protein [Nocardia sp. NBC_00565]WUC05567.1 MlaD family protein [Nocardia sp. NBC_00565]